MVARQYSGGDVTPPIGPERVLIPARLQWYVLRDLLRVACISAVALTAVIFVGMSLSLMRRGFNILQVYDVLPYAAAMSLPYAMPCAFLLGSVFVFGRLSGGNEINAMRCSGVNLNTVIYPPLIVASLVCAGTFWLNHYMLPSAVNGIRASGAQIAVRNLGSLAGAAPMRFGRYSIYVAATDARTGAWLNVIVIEYASGFPGRVIKAREGRYTLADDDRTVILLLKDVSVYHPRLNEPEDKKPARFGEMQLPVPLESDDDKGQPGTALQNVSSMSDSRILDVRPKFLKLSELLQLRAALRARVEAARARGEYAGVSRPKTARKEVQKRRDVTARATLNPLRLKEEAARERLKAADAAVAEAGAIVASAQGERDRLAQQAQEGQTRLDDLQRQLEQLAEQRKIEAGQEEEELKERVAQIDRDILSLTRQAAAAKARLDMATISLKHAEEALAGAVKALAEKQEAQATAAKTAAELGAELKQARADYARLQRQWEVLRAWEMFLQADSEYESRNAGSLATFLFVLMGIPLGILSRRGNVILAFLISFGAVLAVYYPLAMIAQMLDGDAHLPARIAEWMPDIAVGAMGLVLMVRGVRR